MKLSYPTTCACGAECPVGTDVRWVPIEEEGIASGSASGVVFRDGRVMACPACDVSLSRVADVGVDRIDPGITLAERMRRNAAKRGRK